MSLESEEQFFKAVVKEESYYEALAIIKNLDIYNSIKKFIFNLKVSSKIIELTTIFLQIFPN